MHVETEGKSRHMGPGESSLNTQIWQLSAMSRYGLADNQSHIFDANGHVKHVDIDVGISRTFSKHVPACDMVFMCYV